MAILDTGADPLLYQMTIQHAEQELQSSRGTEKAWAHGTLAELVLLKHYHQPGENPAGNELPIVDPALTRDHCEEMVEICISNSFPIDSTLRQFKRYAKYDMWKNEVWDEAVLEAIVVLEAGATEQNH